MRVSSCLLMPEERKFLAFDDSVFCTAVWLGGSPLFFGCMAWDDRCEKVFGLEYCLHQVVMPLLMWNHLLASAGLLLFGLRGGGLVESQVHVYRALLIPSLLLAAVDTVFGCLMPLVICLLCCGGCMPMTLL
ncbi:hypothetical protein Nepgr_031794 [Nepenthes gracilis]|uniref:Uncharacterized protein n=1 Tax=Nepenthes gracilis TaxID=150966 RepID=A0AAD3TIT4_NEPGR|nr:hypothetical protein Nepgr_031794 [Nepenthes gracilis]